MRLLTSLLGGALLAAAPIAADEPDSPLIAIPGVVEIGATGTSVADEIRDPLDAGTGRMARTRGPEVETEPRTSILSPMLATLPADMVGTSLRMQGENPVAEFSIFLPSGVPPGNLAIAHNSGVDVLPERSEMRIFVNGVELDALTLENFSRGDRSLVPVPPGIWVPGRNRVRIELTQTHRIFCGPDAAFDLWTDIDLARSGAVIDHRPLVSGPHDFLAAVARHSALGRPVEIRDPASLAKAARPILDEVALRMDRIVGSAPLRYRMVDVWQLARPDTDAAPGERRANAPASEGSAARITLVPPMPGADGDSGFGEISFRRAGDGAEVLVIPVPRDAGQRTEPVRAAVSEMLDELSVTALSAPAPMAPTALAERKIMPVGEPVPLGQIGLKPLRTTSHYFRMEQVFVLPRDWLVLTAQKARFMLDYAYARNLPEESKLLIKINGETVRLLPLVGEGGELIEQFPVKFNANLLEEGPNLIQFEALIPGENEELACPKGNPVLLEILPSTTLEVPDSPAMRQPDLRLPVARLSAGNIDLRGRNISDIGTADRLSLVSSLGKPRPDAAHLTVIGTERVADVPMGDYTFRNRALAEVLEATAPPLPDGPRAPEDTVGAVPERSVFDNAPTETAHAGTLGRVLETFAASAATALARIVPDPNIAATKWLEAQSGRAILMQLDTTRPNDLWLMLGPGEEFAPVAANLAAARRTIDGPHGQISVLGHDGRWRSWADVTRTPRLLEPLTFRNARFVLGNYASWAPGYFTVFLFGLALISAFFALRLVIITRTEE